jgi:AhpD family alkylhydroperoxidase
VSDDPHVIPLIDVDAASPRAKEIFEIAGERGAPDSGVLRILAHDEDVLEGFVQVWWACFDEGTIEITLKELLRVKLADIYGCGYCGTVRSKRAAEAGLSEERIQLACTDPKHESFSEREQLVLEWGELLATDPRSIDEDFTARLKAQFSDAELVELGCLGALCVGFDSLLPTWGVGAHTCQIPAASQAGAAHAGSA